MPPSDIDIAERIVRLETKLDFLISQMDRLPPSPVCITKHSEFETRISSMEAWRNKAIGIFMVMNVFLIIFIDKIKGFFAN